MGICGSSIPPPPKISPALQENLDRIGVGKSGLLTLWRAYVSADKDKNGAVGLREMFLLLNELPNSVIGVFLDQFFKFVDVTEDGRLSFERWVPAVCTYCVFSKEQILRFCFTLLDIGSKGYINKSDFLDFCHTKKGGNEVFPANNAKAVEMFSTSQPNRYFWADFVKFNDHFPYICFPAFRMQATLREKLFGKKFWVKAQLQLQKSWEADEKIVQLGKAQGIAKGDELVLDSVDVLLGSGVYGYRRQAVKALNHRLKERGNAGKRGKNNAPANASLELPGSNLETLPSNLSGVSKVSFASGSKSAYSPANESMSGFTPSNGSKVGFSPASGSKSGFLG